VLQPGRKVRIAGKTAEELSEIEFFRRQHGRFVIKLQGVDSIEDAQTIVGADLSVRRSELPQPARGAFYTFDLKGCSVFGGREENLGVVTDVLDFSGTPILKVDNNGKELLIPFAQSYLKRIDVSGRRIEVELPEGLRELNIEQG